MNNQRRTRIDKLVNQLDEIKAEVSMLAEEEQVARENLPENLQESEQAERMDEAAEALEGADLSFEELIEQLQTAQEL